MNYVPVGRCSAVLVRCFTTHFDFPASDKASARSFGGQVVGQPSATDTRWVWSVIGRSARSHVRQRRRHVLLAVEMHGERQRVHHGAAAALPDVRRQRVRRVADHRDLALRPALEADQLEAVVAALHAEPVDQRREMREPALPGAPCRPASPWPPRRCRAWPARYRPRSRCTACRARGGCPTSIRPWSRRPAMPLLRCLGDQQPRAAVDQGFALLDQVERVAQPRVGAVGGDDRDPPCTSGPSPSSVRRRQRQSRPPSW